MCCRNIHQLIVAFFGTSIISFHSFSQPSLNYTPVISSLINPIDIVSANDGSNRLFIVQKGGIVKVYDQSLNYSGDFLTVKGITTSGERGLLSLAFHPDYKTNGLFFVYYTNAQGNIEIARYKVSSNIDIADVTTKSVIITIPHPGAANHNGGKLNFGTDGYLYFATGDGGGAGDSPNNAQNGNSLLGKMLRIDINNPTTFLNYSIPADNPFVNDTAIADEIWAMGLRNPWRWSFDSQTQDIWIADVGQNKWEEINFIKAAESKGLNFGWRCYEGRHPYKTAACQSIDKYISPIFEYPHNSTTGGFSVTGGFVYRGSEYPSLNGYYIFADYVSGNQWMVTDSSNTWIVKKQIGAFPGNISAFGESEDGTLYACSLTQGLVYKIEVVTGVKFQLLNFNGLVKNDIAELTWSVTEQNLLQYEVESSTDSINFDKKGVITATNLATGNTYTFDDTVQRIPKIFYRLRILNNDGKWDYSKTITIVNNSSTAVKFHLINFSGLVRNNIAELTWSATEQNLLQYEVESSTDSVNFDKKGILAAKNLAAENTYSFTDNIQQIQKIFYRMRIVNNNNKWDYSKTIAVINNSSGANFIYPSVIKNKLITCFIPGAYDHLQVFDMDGALVLKKDIRGITGRIDIQIPNLSKGVYLVKVSNNNSNMIQRISVN